MIDPQVIFVLAAIAAFACFVLAGIELGHTRRSLREALAKLRQISRR